jgi:hypothetical protein
VSNTTFEEIGKVLRDHQRFAILSHVAPMATRWAASLRLRCHSATWQGRSRLE